MLSLEEIQKNKVAFLGVAQKYKVCSPELLDFLNSHGFYTNPASTMKSMHCAFEGGLVRHLLNVAEIALKQSESFDSDIRPSKESIVRVSLLHDIGKVGLYLDENREWHRNNLGKMYNFNENLLSMTVGERSIYYITKNNGCDLLNESEYQAILNSDKNLGDDRVMWHTDILGLILRNAKITAIFNEKNKYKTN